MSIKTRYVHCFLHLSTLQARHNHELLESPQADRHQVFALEPNRWFESDVSNLLSSDLLFLESANFLQILSSSLFVLKSISVRVMLICSYVNCYYYSNSFCIHVLFFILFLFFSFFHDKLKQLIARNQSVDLRLQSHTIIASCLGFNFRYATRLKLSCQL